MKWRGMLLSFSVMGCAKHHTNYLESVALVPASRPLHGSYRVGPRVRAAGCDTPNARIDIQDLLQQARAEHDALVQITIQKRVEEQWVVALLAEPQVTRTTCFEVDAFAVDILTDSAPQTAGVAEPSVKQADPIVSPHPGLRALSGWGDLEWGLAPPKDARPIGHEDGFEIWRPNQTSGSIWGAEVAHVRYHYRGNKLERVRFRLPRDIGLEHLEAELGPPTDDTGPVRWTGLTVVVVMDGAEVTVRGWSD